MEMLMSQLTLNQPQIQAALNEFINQPSGMNRLFEMVLNTLMKSERSLFLEDAQQQANKANGYRPINGIGFGERLALNIPRDRLGLFKPIVLSIMREQSEQLNELCFELYAKGLTTRDIEEITTNIYGNKISRSEVSRITASFADEMKAFRERTLDNNYPIIMMDATYIKTRRDSSVSSEAYYIVLGVRQDTTREILGIYNAPTESAGEWDEILEDIKKRGVKSCNLFVTDALTGLSEAIEKHFSCSIQKCVLHFKRNILRKTKKSHRTKMIEDLAKLFAMDDKEDTAEKAQARLKTFVEHWGVHYDNVKRLDWSIMHYYFSYTKFNPLI